MKFGRIPRGNIDTIHQKMIGNMGKFERNLAQPDLRGNVGEQEWKLQRHPRPSKRTETIFNKMVWPAGGKGKLLGSRKDTEY
jgi:hypothetical protein